MRVFPRHYHLQNYSEYWISRSKLREALNLSFRRYISAVYELLLTRLVTGWIRGVLVAKEALESLRCVAQSNGLSSIRVLINWFLIKIVCVVVDVCLAKRARFQTRFRGLTGNFPSAPVGQHSSELGYYIAGVAGKLVGFLSVVVLCSGVPMGGMGGSGPPTFQKDGPQDFPKKAIKLVS